MIRAMRRALEALERTAGATRDSHDDEEPMSSTTAGLPPVLAVLPAERIVDLDVREDLRSGREPFSRIMAARRELPAGAALRVRAIFEPVPLYAVMAKQGLDHWTERLAADDWRVWFHPADPAEAPADPAPPAAGAGAPEDEGVVVLDVRGLEPPEPMVRTLEALEALPPGATLVQVNERVPRFLLPEVERRGFTYEVREQPDGVVRVFFCRAAGPRG